MATLISHSPAETLALGEQWGQSASAGWVIGLSGELGSGKTQLVKGIARGLGIPQHVLSPTFTLVHEYRGGRLVLAHLDLYRLETTEQIVGAGLDDYLWQPAGVTVVEWIERWLPSLDPQDPQDPSKSAQRIPIPRHSRFVRFASLGENERQITYEDFGN